MKGDLYRLLGEDPSVMANDQDLADFYADMEGGVIAQLKDMDDEQLVLFDMDATVLAQVQQNRDQLKVILEQVNTLMGDLSDPNLTASQRVTLVGTLAGLQQTCPR